MRYEFHRKREFSPKRVVIKEMTPDVFQSGALLFYVSSGRGTLWINGVAIPVMSGSFGWLHSYHIFRFEPEWEETIELYTCAFDYAPASYISYQDSLKITRDVMTECAPVVGLEGEEAAYIKELMEEFIQEGAKEEPADIVMGYSIFLELSTLFLRCSAREWERHPEDRFERSLAWKLLQHIFTYSNENLTRKRLAGIYGVTERDVSCQLNLAAGQGFARLLNCARVERACDMLYYGGLTMHYIAHYVGYHSETSFYRAFKEIKGMTPQEYQKSMWSGPEKDISPIDASALAILNYLLSHYREHLTVAETAKALYIEKNSVNSMLKANFGLGLADILTELRMTYAKTLLKNGSMPAADVAFACGYTSPHTFSRIFSAQNGMTPGEYRKFAIHEDSRDIREERRENGWSVH